MIALRRESKTKYGAGAPGISFCKITGVDAGMEYFRFFEPWQADTFKFQSESDCPSEGVDHGNCGKIAGKRGVEFAENT